MPSSAAYLNNPLSYSIPWLDFRFSEGCFAKTSVIRHYFALFSANNRLILTRFDVKIATAPCIVNASSP